MSTRECGNCFQGKSDMDHDCRVCGGTGQVSASTAVAVLPECPTHGQMELQQPGTPEQAWCGVWYRCRHCTTSVLLPSANIQPALTRGIGDA